MKKDNFLDCICEDDGIIILILLAVLFLCSDDNGCGGGFLDGIFDNCNIILIILVIYLLFCDDEC